METKFVYYSLDRARNGEHFEFIRTFLATFSAEKAAKLGLGTHRSKLDKKFQEEDDALKIIQSYSDTADIAALDAERDKLFRYITQEVKNQQRSPVAARKKAADNLAPLVKTYAGTADKTQRDETGLLVNFIADIRKFSYDADLTALNLHDVVDALEAANNAFEASFAGRISEKEYRRSADNMKAIRPLVEGCYRDIITMLNSLDNAYQLTPDSFTEMIIVLDELAPVLNANANDLHEAIAIREKQGSGKQPDRPVIE